jgi:hypothetical protein
MWRAHTHTKNVALIGRERLAKVCAVVQERELMGTLTEFGKHCFALMRIFVNLIRVYKAA